MIELCGVALNMILDDRYYMPEDTVDIRKYDIIIKSANEIIENEKATHLGVSFRLQNAVMFQ